jgi:hypothetical protein
VRENPLYFDPLDGRFKTAVLKPGQATESETRMLLDALSHPAEHGTRRAF